MGEKESRVRQLRGELADLERRRRQLETELTVILIELDRRPPDGSDQPRLFEPEAQPKLW